MEEVGPIFLRRNTVIGNNTSQILYRSSEFDSEDNCFENRGPDQLITEFWYLDRYKTLAEYQKGKQKDLHSREGGCPLPDKVDVHRIHAETLAYTERARKILAGEIAAPTAETTTATPETPGAGRAWWQDLFKGCRR